MIADDMIKPVHQLCGCCMSNTVSQRTVGVGIAEMGPPGRKRALTAVSKLCCAIEEQVTNITVQFH